jgi:hypothetical protein
MKVEKEPDNTELLRQIREAYNRTTSEQRLLITGRVYELSLQGILDWLKGMTEKNK